MEHHQRHAGARARRALLGRIAGSALLATLGAGCAANVDSIELDGEPDAHHRGPPMALNEDSRAIVAMRGDVVVALDADTLEELDVVDDRERMGRLDLGGALGAPGALAIWTYDEDESGAEIARVDGDSAAGVLGFYGGAVSAVPLSMGTLVVESEIGDRLRLTPNGGGFTSSVPCPRPTSFRLVRETQTAATLEALAFRDGGLVSLQIELDEGGVRSCEGQPIATAATEDARLVELASPVARAVIDVVEGELVVTPLDGVTAGGAARFACAGARVEHAVSLAEPDGGTLVVALVSGPAVLMVVRVAPDGGVSLAAGRRIAVPLPAEPMRADRGPSHDLVLVDRRVFVSTAAGVAAFDLDEAGALESVDAPAGLRGPLARMAR